MLSLRVLSIGYHSVSSLYAITLCSLYTLAFLPTLRAVHAQPYLYTGRLSVLHLQQAVGLRDLYLSLLILDYSQITTLVRRNNL